MHPNQPTKSIVVRTTMRLNREVGSDCNLIKISPWELFTLKSGNKDVDFTRVFCAYPFVFDTTLYSGSMQEGKQSQTNPGLSNPLA
jgi:hypothetical protein